MKNNPKIDITHKNEKIFTQLIFTNGGGSWRKSTYTQHQLSKKTSPFTLLLPYFYRIFTLFLHNNNNTNQ